MSIVGLHAEIRFFTRDGERIFQKGISKINPIISIPNRAIYAQALRWPLACVSEAGGGELTGKKKQNNFGTDIG